MNRFLIITGNILFTLGLLLLTPLADFLPVDGWAGMGGSTDAGDSVNYQKVVPTDGKPNWLFAGLMIIGFMMILIGRLRMRQ